MIGAGRGTGQAIAEALGETGAHVVLASRSLQKLEAVAAQIRQRGVASTLVLDVTDQASRAVTQVQIPMWTPLQELKTPSRA